MKNEPPTKLLKRLLSHIETKEVHDLQQKISEYLCDELNIKVIQQIRKGDLKINPSKQSLQNYINHQKKQYALKQIQLSDDYYNYDRDINIMIHSKYDPNPEVVKIRRKKQKLDKILNEKKKILEEKETQLRMKEFKLKVKEWDMQIINIKKKKKVLEKRKTSAQKNQEQKKIREDLEQKEFNRMYKKKVIEGKLKQLEQRKLERSQQLIEQNSIAKSSQQLPRYLRFQRKHKEMERQKEIQRSIILKNRRESLALEYDQIRDHQKLYINRIKNKLNNGSKSRVKSVEDEVEKRDEFSLIKKNQQEMKKLQDKLKHIKKFQGKIRQLNVNIDKEKKKQAMIQRDRARNPVKYNFLSQKALSDEQIYDQFKEFEVNTNQKQIGNKYLEELKMRYKPKMRSQSQQLITPSRQIQIQKSPRKHIDYLKQFRSLKKISPVQVKKKKILEQLPQKKIRSVQKKQKKVKNDKNYYVLLQRSQKFEQMALNNIRQLEEINDYEESLRKQNEIDEHYAKAIRAKLSLASNLK